MQCCVVLKSSAGCYFHHPIPSNWTPRVSGMMWLGQVSILPPRQRLPVGHRALRGARIKKSAFHACFPVLSLGFFGGNSGLQDCNNVLWGCRTSSELRGENAWSDAAEVQTNPWICPWHKPCKGVSAAGTGANARETSAPRCSWQHIKRRGPPTKTTTRFGTAVSFPSPEQRKVGFSHWPVPSTH